MGTVSSSFKATVTFGGLVSSSFKSSAATLVGSIKQAERESEKLTKQQTKLAKKIEETAKAGKSTKKLQTQYDELSESIKKADTEAAKLNKTLMTRKAWARPFKDVGLTAVMKGVHGGVSRRWESVKTKGLVPSMLPAAGKALGGIGGLIAGGIGSALAVNAETAEQAGLARSYGVKLSTFKAWDAAGKMMGLSGENIGDLGEELANKVGEFKTLGKQSSLSDAFTGLGLTSADLAGKTNEEQMALVLDQALKTKDEQVGRSMVDMIMGGEGNKILTWMKLSGKTYEQLIAEQKKYILTTDAGTDGAVRGQMALSNLWTALSSAAQDVIGDLMGDLAPSITGLADEFTNWFRGGGEKTLVKGVEEFASGLQDFWRSKLSPILSSLWGGLQALAGLLQEIVPDKYLYDTKTRAVKAYDKHEASLIYRQAYEDEMKARGEETTPEGYRQAALEGESVWEGARLQKALESNAAYSNYDGEAMSMDDYLLSLTDPGIKSTSGDAGVMPLSQTFSMPITIMTQPGADAQEIGSAITSWGVDFTKNIGNLSSGTYTPASYNGG
ncbi:hypothetical protein HAX39_25160 [Citrobacter freundii]|nr:hypothetical protein [Citrobacter freundii]